MSQYIGRRDRRFMTVHRGGQLDLVFSDEKLRSRKFLSVLDG